METPPWSNGVRHAKGTQDCSVRVLFQQESRRGGHRATVQTAVSVLPGPHPLHSPEHRARPSGQQSSGEGHLPGERGSEAGLTAQ